MRNSSDTPVQLDRIYRSRLQTDAAYRNRVWKVLSDAFFSQYVAPDAVVLDLGCGYGEFINNIQCRKKFAMDLNPGARAQLNPDVTFLEQDSSARWDFADDVLDVVFSSNFFEHLPSKQLLSDTIAEARRCLRPGGRLIAVGPNIRFVGPAYWDFWDHHLPLTDASISELLEMHEFRVERSLDRFLPYTAVKGPHVPPYLVRLYLTMPFVWKVFGKQFFIVASKQQETNSR
jgi:SAM-dependent methyltransferase